MRPASTGYRDSGALVVAADRDDAEPLQRMHELQRFAGPRAEWLTPRDAARSNRASRRASRAASWRRAGRAAPAGARPRALATAGEELATRPSATRWCTTAALSGRAHHRGERWLLRTGGRRRRPCSAGLAPFGDGAARPSREGTDPRAPSPRADGRAPARVMRTPALLSRAARRRPLVLGATVEERGFDRPSPRTESPTAPGRATRPFPRSPSWSSSRPRAGLRPATPDNVPVVGPTRRSTAYLGDRPLAQRHPACPADRGRGRRIASADCGV